MSSKETNAGEEARRVERAYLSPEIANQRFETLKALSMRAGERVLDAGCGPGLLTAALAEQVRESGAVLGVDKSPDMLALAAERCRAMPWVELEEADIRELEVDDAGFDAAACTQVLLYVEDVPGMLGAFHSMLRPGGRLAIVETDWRSCVVNSDDRSLTEVMIDAWDDAVASPNLPARLGPMLRAVGFHAVRVDPIPVLNTVLHDGAYSKDMLRAFVGKAVKKDRVTDARAKEWLADLEHKAKRGEYFFCVNRFLFTGVR